MNMILKIQVIYKNVQQFWFCQQKDSNIFIRLNKQMLYSNFGKIRRFFGKAIFRFFMNLLGDY